MMTIALAKIVGQFEILSLAAERPSHATSVPKFVEWQLDGIPVLLRRWGRRSGIAVKVVGATSPACPVTATVTVTGKAAAVCPHARL